MSLSARIMNLPLDGVDSAPENLRAAYFSGHRDARHAAAELAAEDDAIRDELVAALEVVLRRIDDGGEYGDGHPVMVARAALARARLQK